MASKTITARDKQIATDRNSTILKATGASTDQIVSITDLISEGEIEGLVNGGSSVYLNDDPVTDVSVSSINSVSLQNGLLSVTNGATTATFNKELPELPTGTIRLMFLRSAYSSEVSVDAIVQVNSFQDGSLRLTTTSAFFDAATMDWESGYTGLDSGRLRIQETGKTLGGILDIESSTQAVFTPTATNRTEVIRFDEEAEGNTTILEIDGTLTATDIVSANGSSTITFSPAFPYPTGDYAVTFSGAFSTQDLLDEVSYKKFEGISVQFRNGTLTQRPMVDFAGTGATAIVSSSFTTQNLEYFDSLSDPAQSITEIPVEMVAASSASTGLGLSTEQASEVDEVVLIFSYAAMINNKAKSGDQASAGALYDIDLTIYRGLTESTITLAKGRRHSGKSTSAISFEERINLEPFKPFNNFKITVTRKTRHSGRGVRADGTNTGSDYVITAPGAITSATSIIKEPLNFPLTAYANVTFSSKEFQNVPTRTYHARGLKIAVPSNYTTREQSGNNTNLNDASNPWHTDNLYSGLWDGTFASTKVYTDNPAWIFYDVLTNNRYGLGEWISATDIDKFALYKIARYCDELVPDGRGGYEPRFRTNIYLTKATDAYKVIKDIASTFLSMLYWMEGQVLTVVDQAKDPVYTFSKGNVIDGIFSYETTGGKTRSNQVIVSWNNPESNYALEPLIVEDRENIVNTGKIITEDAAAFGCTSEGQAYRYGRWKLWTAVNQTRVVSFKTAINAAFLTPGDIILLQDADEYNLAYSGRIKTRPSPETGLTLSTTAAPGEIGGDQTGFTAGDRDKNIVLSGEATLPASFSSDAVLWEHGGSGVGSWLGVRQVGGVYNLVLRAGDGASVVTSTNTNTIVAEVPISQISQFNGGVHNITWELQPDAGRVRLWIDNILYIDETTSGGGAFENDDWSGGDAGGWGQSTNSTSGSYSTSAWPVTPTTSLRVYNNQTVSQSYSADEYSTVLLDRQVSLNAGSTYYLSVLLQDDNDSLSTEASHTIVETREVTSTGNVFSLDVSVPFSLVPSSGSVWVLREEVAEGAVNGSGKEYKILGIAEDDKNTYSITAVEHYNDKFSAIEEDFTLTIADTVYPKLLATDTVPAPANIYIKDRPNYNKPGNEFEASWDIPVNSDGSRYEYTAAFEISHNVPGYESPLRVPASTRSYLFESVEEANYTISVRTVNSINKRSLYTSATFEVQDQYALAIPREAEGIPIGGISNIPLSLTASYVLNFENPTSVTFASAANLSEAVQYTNVTGLDTLDPLIPSGISHYVLFDTSEAALLGINYYTGNQFGGVPFWYKVTEDVANAWTSTATISYTAGASKILLLNASTYYQAGDIIKFDDNDDVTLAAKVVRATSTSIFLDRSFDTSATSKQAYRNALRIDYTTDTIVGRFTTNQSTMTSVFSTLISVDPGLITSARFATLISDSSTLTYDSNGDLLTSLTNNQFTVTAVGFGFVSPEFKITGGGFSYVDENEETVFSSGTDGVYEKTLTLSSTTYTGVDLVFQVLVREANDPNNTSKQYTAVLTIASLQQAPRGPGRWHINVDLVDYTSATETGALPSDSADAQEAWDNGQYIGTKPGTELRADQAWFYKGAIDSPTNQSVWIYNGSAWENQTEVIDGNLIVSDTITADKINVDDIAAINADLGSITAGTLQGGTVPDANAAPSNAEKGSFFDLDNGKFVVGDATNHILYDGTDLNVKGTVTIGSTDLTEENTLNTYNKGKTIALLLNKNYQGVENPGECALVGLNNQGVPVVNTDGFIVWNGSTITIERNQYGGAYTVLTHLANKRGFICFDTTKSNPFTVQSTVMDVAFVYKEGSQWYYDNNSSTPTSFTPTNDMVALGWIETGIADLVVRGGLFGEPVSLTTASFPSDIIQSGTIGGIKITSTKLYEGTGTFNSDDTGFYLDNSGQFSLKDKLTFDPSTSILSVNGDITAQNLTIAENATVEGTLSAANLVLDGTTIVASETGALSVGTVGNSNFTINTINADKLVSNSVTASQIASSTITSAEIAADTITASNIASSTITSAEIAADTITADNIAANTITSAEILASTITATEIAGNTITADEIASNTITADEIASNTITADEIASNTITANEIATGTITANEIAAGTITANEIESNTITANEIAAGTITAQQIDSRTIKASNLESETITALEISARTITASRLAAGAVTVSKLDIGATDLINPVSVTENVNRWGGFDDAGLREEGDDIPAGVTLEYNSANNALAISGQTVTLTSDSFKINHGAIYRVRGRIRKTTLGGDIKILPRVYSSFTKGKILDTVETGTGTGVNLYPYDELRDAESVTDDAVFVHLADITNNSGFWFDFVYYIIGGSEKIEDCRNAVQLDNMSAVYLGTPYIRVGNFTNSQHIALSIILETDAADTGEVYLQDFYISEVSDGSIVADNITANKISSISADLGDITAGTLQAGNLQSTDIPAVGKSGAYFDFDNAKFIIGERTKYLSWDGTDFRVRGDLRADSGYIGGFAIENSEIRSGSNYIALSPVEGIRLGGTTTESADFTVDADGNLKADSAVITGDITATSLDISGATVTGILGTDNLDVSNLISVGNLKNNYFIPSIEYNFLAFRNQDYFLETISGEEKSIENDPTVGVAATFSLDPSSRIGYSYFATERGSGVRLMSSSVAGSVFGDANTFSTSIFTLSVWFKPTTVARYHDHFIAGRQYLFELFARESNDGTFSLFFEYSESGSSSMIPHEIVSGIPIGSWHHLVLVKGSGSNNVSLYLNTKKIADITSMTPSVSIAQRDFVIGTNTDSSNNFLYETGRALIGHIGDIKVFNTALSQQKITDLYLYPQGEGKSDIDAGTIGGVNIESTKLYEGVGTFNSDDTGFYLDSSGQFSLKDKLSFDGTDLSVSGDITATSLRLAEGLEVFGQEIQLYSNLVFFPDELASGVGNVGEIAIDPGKIKYGTITRQLLTKVDMVTPFENTITAAEGFYVIWGASPAWGTATDVTNGDARFATSDSPTLTNLSGSNEGIFVAIYDSANTQWKAIDNGGNTVDFTLLDTDIKIAYGTKTSTTGGIDTLDRLGVFTNDPFSLDTVQTLTAGTTITDGGITMSAGGAIKGGQTAYATGNGFFLGYDTDKYKFSIGNATNYLTWDGTDLAVTGNITADTLTFDGANVTGTLKAANIDVEDVITAGSLITDSATINNDIKIGSGESVFIADSNGIYLGNETFADAEFSVTPAGALKATSGVIGGFTLSSTALTASSNGAIKSSGTSFSEDSLSPTGSAGFYLGYAEDIDQTSPDNSGYRFFVGNSSTESLLWNGSELTLNGKVLSGSTVGGQPVNELIEKVPSLWAQAALAPRVATQAINVRYLILEDNTNIYKNDLLEVSGNSGTVNVFTDVNAGDVFHSNKPTVLVHDGRALPSLSMTGTKYVAMSTRGSTQTFSFYAPYGDTTVRFFASQDSNPQKTAGGTLIDWSDENEYDATTNPEGWTRVDIAANSVGTHEVSTAEVAYYYWIKADLPILASKVSGSQDYMTLKPASREIISYDEGSYIKFEPAKADSIVVSQVGSFDYAYSTDVLFGHGDTGDGSGGDGTAGIPWSACGDTYGIPHTISNYQIATIEPSIVSVYYYDSVAEAWILHKTHDLSGASRTNFLTALEGTNDYSGGSGLGGGSNAWRFVGTGRFALRTNDLSNKEYFALGYRSDLRTENTIVAGKIQADEIETLTLSAIQSNLGSITAGTLQSATATPIPDADSAPSGEESGSFFDLNSGKFVVGDATNYILYDGTGLTISGSVSATTGTIGGFTVGAEDLTAGSEGTKVSLSTANGIHLGADAFAEAPFSVSTAGALTATNATITGDISATSLSLDSSITIGSDNLPVDVYSTTSANVDPYFTNVNSESWFVNSAGSTVLSSDTEFTYEKDGVNLPTGRSTYLKALSSDDANDQFHSERILIDTNKTYKVTVWARQPSGDKVSYLLVGFYDLNGNTINNTSTPTSDAENWPGGVGSYHYYGLFNDVFPSDWTKYEIVFGGNSLVTIPTGAVTLNVGALTLRNGGTNQTTIEFAEVLLEEIDNSTSNASTTSLGGTTITSSKLYQGDGTFNTENTGFYLDSTGKFSLKDKLSFDSSTSILTVNGDITAQNLTIAENATVEGTLSVANLKIDGTTITDDGTGAAQVGTIGSDNISVTSIAAINSDLGAITAGSLKGGTIPDADAAPSDQESGSFFDLDNGKFVVGNATNNILFDGTNLSVAGDITAENLDITGANISGKLSAANIEVDDVFNIGTINTDLAVGGLLYEFVPLKATNTIYRRDYVNSTLLSIPLEDDTVSSIAQELDSKYGKTYYATAAGSGAVLLSDEEADVVETGDFSYSVWFKSTTTTGDSTARVLSRDASDFWAIAVAQNQTGNQNVIFYSAPSSQSFDGAPVNEWNHVVLTRSGSLVKGYLNGREVTSYNSYSTAGSNRPVVLGTNTEDVINLLADSFIGHIAKIRVYEKALSLLEVQSLYLDPTGNGKADIDAGTIGGVTITPVSLYEGAGNFNNADTGFYLDNTGNFSLENKLSFNSSTSTLSIDGDIVARDLNIENATVSGTLSVANLKIDGTTITNDGSGNAQVGTIGSDNISVTSIAAINSDLGSITAGSLKGGTIPDADAAPSDEESGSFFDLDNGKFVVGDATNHILYDGTDLTVRGSLTADDISTGTLSISRLNVTDFNNLVTDPKFTSLSNWEKNPTSDATVIETVSDATFGTALKIVADGTGTAIRQAGELRPVPSVEADYFSVIYVRSDAAGLTTQSAKPLATFFLGFELYNESTYITTAGGYFPILDIDENWTKIFIDKQFISYIDGVTHLRPTFGITNEVDTGNVFVSNFHIMNEFRGEGIADGSINANSLNIANLSDISSSLGDVTSGSLNINDTFTVSSSGVIGDIVSTDFTIKSDILDVGTTTLYPIASFSAAEYSAAKFIVSAKVFGGNDSHVCEILVAHDGTTAVATQYGSVSTNGDLATYDVDIDSGNVRLLGAATELQVLRYTVVQNLIKSET